jgi:protein-S-isoprenylcysteine O-methyltransferase Ste14
MKNRDDFRWSKTYDLIVGLPLILWFGYAAVRVRPDLAANARGMFLHPDQPLFYLRFFTLFSIIVFDLLLIYLVIVRKRPVKRSSGMAPRLCAVAGTFLGVAILNLRPANLTLLWQVAATFLVFLGSLGSVIVLAQLGKSFSIMPEARRLVTSGPYAYARHPLYAMELIATLGTAIQFTQPWAMFLALYVAALQILRTVFEERVLSDAYSEYADYRARVKRFGVI